MSTPVGRDSRPLVTTTQAAYSLGMQARQFRDWARRRHVTPASSRPNPVRGQALALWDLADIADALGNRQGEARDRSKVTNGTTLVGAALNLD